MFNINDKVVCVDAKPPNHSKNFSPNGHVVENTVYVVCGFSPTGAGIKIVGSPIYDFRSGIEVGWRNDRFRKLSEVQAENRAKRKDKKPK